MADQSVNVVITAVDEASSAFAKVGAEAEALNKKAEAAFAKVGAAMSGLGSSMTMGLTLPIVGGFYEAGKSAMEFQQQMELVATQAGASQEEVNNMSKAVLAMGGQTTQTPVELAKALYHLESVGYRGSEALDALKISADGAMVGNANMEDVTNALSATMVSGIGGVTGFQQAMGVLNATVGAGNMRMQDLASSLSSGIMPAAKTFGLSIQDVGAALATMTDSGVPAEEAATRLRMTFSLLGAPTKGAINQFKSLGLGATQLADDLRNGGLLKAVQDLKTHLESTGMSASQQAEVLARAFGGGRSSSTIMTLLNETDRLSDKYKAITAATTTFGDAVAKTQQDPMVKFKESLSQLQTTFITIGNSLLPTLTRLFEQLSTTLKTLSEKWAQLSPHTQDLIIKGLLITAVLGPLLIGFGSLIAAIGNIVTIVRFVLPLLGAVSLPILAIAAAAAFAAFEIYKHWDSIKKFTTEMIAHVQNAFSNLPYKLGSYAGQAMRAIFIEIIRLPSQIDTVMNDLLSVWGKAWRWIESSGVNYAWSAIKSIVRVMANLPGEMEGAVKGVVGAEAKGIANFGKGLLHGIGIPGFASGVQNFGGGLAYVHQGELLMNLAPGTSVIPRSDVQSMGKGGHTVNISMGGVSVQNQNQADYMSEQIGRTVTRALNGAY